LRWGACSTFNCTYLGLWRSCGRGCSSAGVLGRLSALCLELPDLSLQRYDTVLKVSQPLFGGYGPPVYPLCKIRGINIVGAKVFPEAALIREMQLSTPGWLTWYTKNDQYSKQKLQADLETLRSYYTNRGYLEFAIDSTQVVLSPTSLCRVGERSWIIVNVRRATHYEDEKDKSRVGAWKQSRRKY